MVADEQAFVHAPAGDTRYWYCTDAMPPPSAGVEVSVTDASLHAGTAPIVTVGLVLSMRRALMTADAPAMPTLSVGTARKS